jgi:signal transduction histidine kinase
MTTIWTTEVSCRFLVPWLDMLAEKEGAAALARFVEPMGVTVSELRDETSWVSLRFCEQFVDALVERAGSSEILVQGGRASLAPRYFGFLYPVLRVVGSPRGLYTKLPEMVEMFNKVSRVTIEDRGVNRVTLVYTPRDEEARERSPNICLTRRAQLSAAPTLWGLPLASIKELSCQAAGDSACVYEIRYQNRTFLLATALGLAAGCAAGALLPLGLATWPGVAALALAGLALGRVVDQHRELRETRRFASEQHSALEASARATERRFEELQVAKAEVDQKVQDRTRELSEVNDKLARANEELKQLDQAKGRFFANISHELRTPLTLVLAPLEPLLQGELGPITAGQSQQLTEIRDNAIRLLRQINDLLDLSRLESARMVLRPEDVALAGLLKSIVDAVQPLARRKQLRLELQVDASPTVRADPERLEQAVINLLSNALKFTDTGGQVTVRLGQQQGWAQLAVQDSGVGIPAEALRRVFDRFRQADGSATRKHGGTGIGLALARELVEAHGGRIEVASEPGQGTTFTILLPLEPPEELSGEASAGDETVDQAHGDWIEQLLGSVEYRFQDVAEGIGSDARRGAGRDVMDADAEPAPEARPGSGARETILVVDDNPALLKTLERLLSRYYKVCTATDGKAGLEQARKAVPSLVLCDMMMPVMDGIELCRRLRQDRQTQMIPLLMITARRDVESSVSALDAGADDYVTKPFSIRELMSRIRAQLRIRQLDQTIARADRMEALGSTAAGLAHEIRNPLNVIINGLEAVGKMDGSEPARELIKLVQGEATRILETITALQSFVREGESSFEEADLNAGIEDTLKLLSYKLEGIEVHLDLGLVSKVQCFPAQLNQVFANLLGNAADAIGGQGEIWIRSEEANGAARVTVRDDGPGCPPQDRERIFYPYFTTKPVGKGTGMGLPIARQIAERHGGTLALTSAASGGAEFTLEIPLKPAAASGNGDSPPPR